MENQKLLHFIGSCPVPVIPPSISLLPFYSPSLPLWVSDTQGIVSVHVSLCTSRMLLPSGGIPSAPDHVVWNRPHEGTGEKNLTSQLNNTSYIHAHMYYKPGQTSLCLFISKVATTRQPLSHLACCQ